MTRDELVLNLTTYAGDDYKEEQASLIDSIVDDAIAEVRLYRFRYGYDSCAERVRQTNEVLSLYGTNIQRIAQYHYDKMGKEGVTTFYESGQTTTWGSSGTPDSFFLGIVPVAKIV